MTAVSISGRCSGRGSSHADIGCCGATAAQLPEAYRDPIVGQGFFTDLVHQTMAVDLSELIAPTSPRKPRTKRAKSREIGEGPIVATGDKAALLTMVNQLESEAALEEERKQQVLVISHAEEVLQWSEGIVAWLKAVPTH